MHSFVAAVLLSLAFAPYANARPENSPASQPPGETIATASVAAHFEASTQIGGKRGSDKTDWYFLRQANRIETIRPNGGIAEIWIRDERGDLTLKRIFHPDRRVVEYTTGNLRAMGATAPWTALGSIIDPLTLAQQFKRLGTVKIPHGIATIYKDTRKGQSIEIWWLDQVALPARIIHESDGKSFSLTLKSLHAAPPPSWPFVDDAALASYLVIDAADLGDRHGDPFVRKVEQLDAETHAFDHAASAHSH